MATKPKAVKPKRRTSRKVDVDRIGELERRIKELEDQQRVRDLAERIKPLRPYREPCRRPFPWEVVPQAPWVSPTPPRKPWGEYPWRPPVVWL